MRDDLQGKRKNFGKNLPPGSDHPRELSRPSGNPLYTPEPVCPMNACLGISEQFHEARAIFHNIVQYGGARTTASCRLRSPIQREMARGALGLPRRSRNTSLASTLDTSNEIQPIPEGVNFCQKFLRFRHAPKIRV